MIPPNREANEATLSALQHFAFCRRQWGLIFLERQWAENARTAEGQVFHETAHHGPESEARGDLLILRGLRVASPSLRLGGICDVVEFHRSPSGVSLAGREGLCAAGLGMLLFWTEEGSLRIYHLLAVGTGLLLYRCGAGCILSKIKATFSPGKNAREKKKKM